MSKFWYFLLWLTRLHFFWLTLAGVNVEERGEDHINSGVRPCNTTGLTHFQISTIRLLL